MVPISGSQGTDLNNLNHQSFLAHSPVTRSLLSRVTASQMTSPYGPVLPRRWWQLSAMDFLHEFFYGVKFTIQKRRGILHEHDIRVNRSVVFQWSKDLKILTHQKTCYMALFWSRSVLANTSPNTPGQDHKDLGKRVRCAKDQPQVVYLKKRSVTLW